MEAYDRQQADAVMIYGVGGNPPSDKSKRIPFEERVKSWRDRGYITHFMTGIAWGGNIRIILRVNGMANGISMKGRLHKQAIHCGTAALYPIWYLRKTF